VSQMRKLLSVVVGLVCIGPVVAVQTAAAAKPSLAVNEFRNDTSASWWRGGTGRDLAGMLTNELASMGSFNMVERQKIGDILSEQDLGASGRVRKGTAAKIGKLTGAQYIVMATVTSFEEDTSSKDGGLRFGGFSLGGGESKAYISVDLRVVNTTTGDVDYARTIEANSSASGLSLGFSRFGFGGSLGEEKKTPTGKAIRACVIEIAEYLDCVMVEKDSCMSDYDEKERKRRRKTKGSIELDE